MTRKDAINILDEVKVIDDSMYQYNEAYMSALNTAIKSLEAWDEVIEEIRKWYFNTDVQRMSKDPCVVDAMIDLFIRTIKKHLEEVKK